MSVWTEEELDQQIEEYKRALSACSRAQSYTIAGRTLTRADLPKIRSHLEWLKRQKEVLQGYPGPIKRRGRPKR